MTAHIDYLNRREQSWQDRALAQPKSRGAEFYAAAFAGYSQDAKKDEALETARDQGELLDLRFVGANATNGQMPLGQFLSIMGPLNKAFNATAHHLRTGSDEGYADSDTKDALGLRMAGTGAGSTRVFIMGDSRIDLTGINLMDETLKQTFQLLAADGSDFYDAINAVGGTAARHFSEALHQTEMYGMACDFTWAKPAGSMSWNGTPDEIRRVRSLIENAKQPKKIEQTLTGLVATLNDTGTLHIRDGEFRIKVKYPLGLISEVKRLALGEKANLTVETATFWDEVMQKEVVKHTLVRVLFL